MVLGPPGVLLLSVFCVSSSWCRLLVALQCVIVVSPFAETIDITLHYIVQGRQLQCRDRA